MRSLTRRAAGAEAGAELLRALGHASQTPVIAQVSGSQIVGIEAAAIVGTGKGEEAFAVLELDRDAGGIRVPERIDDRLAGDEEDLGGGEGLQRVPGVWSNEDEADLALCVQVGGDAFERGPELLVGEVEGSKTLHAVAAFQDDAFGGCEGLVERLFRLVIAGHALGRGVEGHQESLHALQQGVVQIAGDGDSLFGSLFRADADVGRKKAETDLHDDPQQKQQGDEAQREKPPGLVEARTDGEGFRDDRIGPDAIRVGRADLEGVAAGTEVRVDRFRAGTDLLPALIRSDESIAVDDLIGVLEVDTDVLDADRLDAGWENPILAKRAIVAGDAAKGELRRRGRRDAAGVDRDDAVQGCEPQTAARILVGRGAKKAGIGRADEVAFTKIGGGEGVARVADALPDLRGSDPYDADGAVEPDLSLL